MRLLAGLLVACSGHAHAVEVAAARQTGTIAEICRNWLTKSNCRGETCAWEKGECAVITTFEHGDELDSVRFDASRTICVPSAVTFEAQAQAFINWFAEHPEAAMLHINEAGPIALASAYPCEK